MATESLIVELDARTQKLDKALDSTDKKLEALDKQTKKSGKSFGTLTKTAGAVGGALTIAATAGLALATALTAVVLKSAASQRELGLLSKQAKLSTENFEALAFATKQYGINAEQIADISKDLADKLGEFGKAGTGAFQDFADVVGLTKEEAKTAALEFENMSSDQVIGKMVSQMEAAGATGNQMTFALESMGNDLSRLIPLFADGSAELKKLTGIFGQATKQLKLSSTEIAGLKDAATSFDLMNNALGKSATLISSQIAPLLSEFFGGVISVVPRATEKIVDFINSFKAPDEITSIKGLNAQIRDSQIRISELRQEQNKLTTSFWNALDSEKSLNTQRDMSNNSIKLEQERIDALIISRDKLTKKEKEAAESKAETARISATLRTGSTGGTGDEIQAIADRFKTEEELLLQKLNNDLLTIGENNELKLQLEQEYQDNIEAIKQSGADKDEAREDSLSKLFSDVADGDIETIDKKNKDKTDSDEAYLGAAMAVGNALFEDNKAIKAGLVVVDTAAGISKAFAELPFPAAVAASIGIAATGVAQLGAIQGASKGSSTAPSAPTVANIEDEPTSELSISDSDASGADKGQIITLKIDSDDSDMALAISGILSKATVNGTIS